MCVGYRHLSGKAKTANYQSGEQQEDIIGGTD
jgi:hypothetical protein